MKLEYFASLRQFCAFNISTKQSLAFSQMILQFFCRFLNFTLFSRAHAFLFYKWKSMFVGCSFGAIYTSSRHFFEQSSCPLQTHGGHPISTLTCQNLDKMRGESWAMLYNDIVALVSAYISVLSSEQCKEIQGKYCLRSFRQRSSSSWNSVCVGVCASRLLRRPPIVGRFSVLGTFAWTLVQDAPRWAW